MKTIILYGELGKRFGKYHRYAVRNAAEAIRALRANFPEFSRYMSGAHLEHVGFKVFVGGSSLGKLDELSRPSGAGEVIRLVPVVIGSSTDPGFKVFLGVALIIGGLAVTAATFGGAAIIGGAMISAGVGMTISGIASILSPPPEMKEMEAVGEPIERKPSFGFSGPANTAAQGRTVPVGYGRMIVGSAVISIGIETFDVPV